MVHVLQTVTAAETPGFSDLLREPEDICAAWLLSGCNHFTAATAGGGGVGGASGNFRSSHTPLVPHFLQWLPSANIRFSVSF